MPNRDKTGPPAGSRGPRGGRVEVELAEEVRV
jgi:hypothetical protein